MSMLVLLTVVIGALLGLRFKVFILAPAVGCAIVAVAAMGMVRGEDFLAIFLAALLALIGLQTGYLGGILTRYAFSSARAETRRKASLRAVR